MSAFSPIDMEAALELNGSEIAQLSRSIATAYGVEVMRGTGWKPLRRLFGRACRFENEGQAISAAVAAWRRTDRPARPFPLFG